MAINALTAQLTAGTLAMSVYLDFVKGLMTDEHSRAETATA